MHRVRLGGSDPAFVEEAIEERVYADILVDQFVIGDSVEQRLHLDPGFVLVDLMQFHAIGRFAGMEIRAARAFRRFGKELGQDAAGPPVAAW